MDFTFGKRPLNRNPSSQYSEPSSAIGSDRLQKAIQRNRAKQMKRDRMDTRSNNPPSRPLPGPPTPPLSPQSAPATKPSFRSRFNQNSGPNFNQRPTKAPPVNSFRNNSYSRPAAQRPKAALFNSDEIQERIKERLNAPLNKIKESTSATIDKTKGIIDRWSLKVGWLLCLFLLFRLIVSDGGLADFYQKKKEFDSRVSFKQSVQKENMDLLKEIDSIKNDMSYQKVLVRKHLGYISSDEFLVLFSKED